MTGLQDLQTVTGEQIPLIPYSSRTKKTELKRNEKSAGAKEIHDSAFAHCKSHFFFQEPKPPTGLAWGEMHLWKSHQDFKP